MVKKKCDFKDGLEATHCLSSSYHHHHHHHQHAKVLTNNSLNIKKLVWGGRVGVVRSGSVLFCSVPKAVPERKSARSYVTAVCKQQTGRDYFWRGRRDVFCFLPKRTAINCWRRLPPHSAVWLTCVCSSVNNTHKSLIWLLRIRILARRQALFTNGCNILREKVRPSAMMPSWP